MAFGASSEPRLFGMPTVKCHFYTFGSKNIFCNCVIAIFINEKGVKSF